MSSGDTRIPWKSGEDFNRLTNSIVRVASTSTNTDTCGASNFERTIALAIAFRTPLTGMYSSRSVGHSGVSTLRKTVVTSDWRITSSRVTSPLLPVAGTFERSTPSSLASLRMGGFARTGDAPAGGYTIGAAGVEVDSVAAGCAATDFGAVRLPRRETTWPLLP